MAGAEKQRDACFLCLEERGAPKFSLCGGYIAWSDAWLECKTCSVVMCDLCHAKLMCPTFFEPGERYEGAGEIPIIDDAISIHDIDIDYDCTGRQHPPRANGDPKRLEMATTCPYKHALDDKAFHLIGSVNVGASFKFSGFFVIVALAILCALLIIGLTIGLIIRFKIKL